MKTTSPVTLTIKNDPVLTTNITNQSVKLGVYKLITLAIQTNKTIGKDELVISFIIPLYRRYKYRHFV